MIEPDSRPRDAATIFEEASRLEGAERDAYLESACGGNSELRAEIESMLAARHEQGDFFAEPTQDIAAESTATPGTIIGRYKLREIIGEGGMGVVFVAEQEQPVRRKVALKIVKPGMDTAEVIARFEAERQALAMMDHPNIAKVLDAGSTESGHPYFVMELVRGIPVTKFCDSRKLSVQERMELFVTICQAVQHAHQKGIIHRDIKPSNVLVADHDGKPVPKVIDFGVAKATNQRLTERTIYTRFAQIIGTPMYMSPEQAEFSGLDVDTRSDIYSLGVLLYELLTGRTPFEKQRLQEAAYDEILRIIREEEPPKPSVRISTLGENASSVSVQRSTDPKRLSQVVRGDLDWIVLKAMEKDRTRRYGTATGLGDDVQRFLRDEAISARPPSLGYQSIKFARRNRTTLLTVAVAAVALATIGVLQILDLAEDAQMAAKLEERNARLSQLYFEHIHNLVMSGNDKRAQHAIDEVQREQLIIDEARLQFLKGQRCLYSGRTEDCFAHFQKATELDHDWVLPQAALAMAHILGNKTGEAEAFQRAEELAKKQLDRGKPLSVHEELFLEHLRCILTPATESSIKRLTQIADEELTPLANALLADALTHRASATDDYLVIQTALDRARNAVQNLPGNCCVLGCALHVLTVAAVLPCTAEQRSQYLEEGRRLAESLRRFPEYPAGLAACVVLYDLDDDIQSLLEILPTISGRSGIGAFYAAASLIRHRRYDVAAALFPRAEDTCDLFLLMGQAYTLAFTPNSDTEIVKSYESLKNIVPGKWFTPECLLLMQKDSRLRTSECQAVISRTQVAGWNRELLSYIAKDSFDDATSEALLASASVSKDGCRRRESRSNFMIALRCLAENETDLATKYLENCQDIGYQIEYVWARAFLARLENDPAWPVGAR